MDPINAARVLVFAYDVVVPFVNARSLSWIAHPVARAALLVSIALLAVLDMPLALLVALGYLETEIFHRTAATRAYADGRRDRESEGEYRRLMRGTLVGRPTDEVAPKEAPLPFLSEDSLRKAAEDNVVPGASLFTGIRQGSRWSSAQGYGDADGILPA